jgi:hypothetical protein
MIAQDQPNQCIYACAKAGMSLSAIEWLHKTQIGYCGTCFNSPRLGRIRAGGFSIYVAPTQLILRSSAVCLTVHLVSPVAFFPKRPSSNMATTPIVTPAQFAVNSIWGKNALRYRTPPADRGTRHEKRKSAMPFFNSFIVCCPMEALHVLLERFFEPQSKHDKLCTLLPWIHNLASPDESKSQSLQWWPQNVTYTYLKYKEASHDITDEGTFTGDLSI